MEPTDLAFAGLAQQADLIQKGEVSSAELTDLYLERIDRIDPKLNAYRVVFAERARAEAAQADARRRSGDTRALLGVPIAIKDDADVAGELTARGTSAITEPAAADSENVRRLRSAGAVILGKTNVPELTIVPFTESPTWGITRNPWDLQRTSGGSSGGSAAAVAAGLCAAALGSDGAGSIRIPAGSCGLFGLKPQRGRTSTAPLVEPWNGMAIWGPIARRVADSARFLDAIGDGGGGDSFAAAAAREPGRMRIAVARKPPPGVVVSLDAEQAGALEGTIDLLRSLGHTVEDRELDYGMSGINV
ncbi:MAG: amidase, partial [Solirubrobacteraceae bacterium]|nr:amidase [Solirubrobacteraceae bacterium]